MNINNTITYDTHFGKITLYQNEYYIGSSFRQNIYWDEDTLLKLKQYIDPNRNILEIGGHCGTSTIVYSSFLNKGKINVYEPQNNLYKLLLKNIEQNNLQNKIRPFNSGVFCFNGIGNMHDIDIDGCGGNVTKRYNEEIDAGCNFGGICLGKEGEPIKLTTVDSMKLENVGFIHCDAQGSEPFIFSKSLETIKRDRPVIFYENIEFETELASKLMFQNICNQYPQYSEESMFDIKKYCTETLNYSECIEKFNGGIDTLLIP